MNLFVPSLVRYEKKRDAVGACVCVCIYTLTTTSGAHIFKQQAVPVLATARGCGWEGTRVKT